jgi:GalNAc5-diNAcBac-PP-undecaprenol beta-1,3-glucosyltransferase
VSPLATVIIPTHDHGPTLRYSVESALRQTVEDIEVVIVGDGMPDAAAIVAREVARCDERIRLLERPKGPRLGEGYRHAILDQVDSRFVFYLSDDDLWLPEHVATLVSLFETSSADFAHALPLARRGDGTWIKSNIDLGLEFHRRAMLGGFNRVGLTCAAHRLDSYRRLPHGWRTTPEGAHTDLHMWRQWLQEPWARFASSSRPTVLTFPSSVRQTWSLADRLQELEEHQPVLTDPSARCAWLSTVISDDFPRAAWLEAHWPETQDWLANREAALAWHRDQLDEVARWLASREEALAWHQKQLADAACERDRLHSELQAIRRTD